VENEPVPFQVGDQVDCLSASGQPSVGTVLAVQPGSNGSDNSEAYVVEIRPNVLGIFHASQLRRLIQTHEELGKILNR